MMTEIHSDCTCFKHRENDEYDISGYYWLWLSCLYYFVVCWIVYQDTRLETKSPTLVSYRTTFCVGPQTWRRTVGEHDTFETSCILEINFLCWCTSHGCSETCGVCHVRRGGQLCRCSFTPTKRWEISAVTWCAGCDSAWCFDSAQVPNPGPAVAPVVHMECESCSDPPSTAQDGVINISFRC